MRLYQKFYVHEKPQSKRIMCPADVYESLKPIANADQESLWIIGYSIKNIEIYRECVFLGGPDSAVCDPRIIFKRLITHDCSAFIIIHNHPGGTTEPSNEDIGTTKRLKAGGELLNIPLIDSIIIADEGYCSMVETKIF